MTGRREQIRDGWTMSLAQDPVDGLLQRLAASDLGLWSTGSSLTQQGTTRSICGSETLHQTVQSFVATTRAHLATAREIRCTLLNVAPARLIELGLPAEATDHVARLTAGQVAALRAHPAIANSLTGPWMELHPGLPAVLTHADPGWWGGTVRLLLTSAADPSGLVIGLRAMALAPREASSSRLTQVLATGESILAIQRLQPEDVSVVTLIEIRGEPR